MIAEFNISLKGLDSSDANSLISFGGMSPGGSALFVLISIKLFWTSKGLNTGILEISYSGIIISFSFNGSYSWLTLLNLSAMSSACSWIDKCFIDSTIIGSDLCWS